MLALVALAGVLEAVAHQRILSGDNAVVLLYLAFAVVGVVVALASARQPDRVGAAGCRPVLHAQRRQRRGTRCSTTAPARGRCRSAGWRCFCNPAGHRPWRWSGLLAAAVPDRPSSPSRRWRPGAVGLPGDRRAMGGGCLMPSRSAPSSPATFHVAANGDLVALDNPTGIAAMWGCLAPCSSPLIAVSWLALARRAGARLPAAQPAERRYAAQMAAERGGGLHRRHGDQRLARTAPPASGGWSITSPRWRCSRCPSASDSGS